MDSGKLSWTDNAKKAKSFFFRKWNDIDIYIEDSGISSKKLAKILLSRCLKGHYRVFEIFSLGNKEKVLEFCAKDNKEDARPRLYLIDGDLDLLIEHTAPPLKRLYRLNSYCIENILIDEGAIGEFLFEEDPSRERHELLSAFEYEKWVSDNGDLLLELFIEYALSKKFNPSEPTVSYKVNNLVSDDSGNLDPPKTKARIAEIRSKTIAAIGDVHYSESKKEIIKSIEDRGLSTSLKVASGKDYLLPLLRLKIRKHVPHRCENTVLNIRFSKHCRIDGMTDLVHFCNGCFQNTTEGQLSLL